MNFTEIFEDSLKYPISEPNTFIMIGIVALISCLATSLSGFSTNSILLIIFYIISLVAGIFLLGYGVSIVSSSINGYSEMPKIDLVNNILDGIKALIINCVYYIIPILVFVILLLLSGNAMGNSAFNLITLGAFNLFFSFIIFLIFSILGEIAIARFAKTGDFIASLNMVDVFHETQEIGFLNVLSFIIVQAIIIFVLILILSLFALIPFIGLLISSFIIGAYIIFFTNRSLGLFYGNC